MLRAQEFEASYSFRLLWSHLHNCFISLTIIINLHMVTYYSSFFQLLIASCCNPHCKGCWSFAAYSESSPWWMTWTYHINFEINSDKVSHAFWNFGYQIWSTIKHLHEGRFLSRLLHLITNKDCSFFIIEKKCIHYPGCLSYYEPNQWHTVYLVSECEQCLRSKPLWHLPTRWYCDPYRATYMMSMMIIQLSNQL